MKYRLIIFAIFIFFAVLLFFLYQNYKVKIVPQSVTTSVVPTRIPTSVPKAGLLSLRVSDTTAEIVATSDGKVIVGYDVLIKFDPNTVDINKATSLLPDFTVYPTKKDNIYVVTGTKKLGSKIPSTFSQTPILRLTLIPKIKGTISLILVDELGRQKTQMVDENTQILRPQLGELLLK